MKKSEYLLRMLLVSVLIAALLLSSVAGAQGENEPPSDEITTFAGTGGHGHDDGEEARFNMPHGVFATNEGLLVFDSFNNLLRFIDWDGNATTIAGNVLNYDSHRFPMGGYVDGTAGFALFNRPVDGLKLADGRILIADSENHSIRVVNSTQSQVGTFAGGNGAGHRDGLAAQAQFNFPSAIAADASGNIFVADAGNHVVRKITLDGMVTTVAGIAGRYGFADGHVSTALFNSPMGIAVSHDGQRIFVADTANHLIRAIVSEQVITFGGELVMFGEVLDGLLDDEDDFPIGGFADSSAAAPIHSRFSLPQGLVIWNDYLIVADTGNHRIRLISPTGFAMTLAGTGDAGYINISLAEAEFGLPTGLALSGDYLFIADSGNNVIRRINLTSLGGS